MLGDVADARDVGRKKVAGKGGPVPGDRKGDSCGSIRGDGRRRDGR